MADTPPTWLNKDFLEKALRSNEKNPDITVTSCDIKRAAMAGDHYGSEMYRANLKTEDNKKAEDISVIIKCKLPKGELSKIIEEWDIFIKEERTFNLIHTPLCDILKNVLADNFQPFAAKCIYSSIEPEALILEDLKRESFRLPTVTHGLDLKHCLLVMRKIAQYHASSVVLRHQDPSRFETFMTNYYSERKNDGMSGFFSSTIKVVIEEASKWPGYETCQAALSAMKDIAIDLWGASVCRDEAGFNVLIHGDLWMNNMMFRYSPKNEELQDVRFVDFQMSYVTSPAIDLMYFINSSASPEVIENNFDVLIDEYYNTLCEILSKLGHQDLQPTKDHLNSELKKKQVFGVLCSTTIRAFALADRNHLPDIENIIKKNDTVHLSNPFKEVIKKLLPLYGKWGWLKV